MVPKNPRRKRKRGYSGPARQNYLPKAMSPEVSSLRSELSVVKGAVQGLGIKDAPAPG